MCELLLSGLITCYGALGYAASLDDVAERRYNATWGRLSRDPASYQALLGVKDCELLGRTGWLIVDEEIYKAQIADCSQHDHPWPSGYLGDVNLKALNYEQAYLILPPRRARWWYEERH